MIIENLFPEVVGFGFWFGQHAEHIPANQALDTRQLRSAHVVFGLYTGEHSACSAVGEPVTLNMRWKMSRSRKRDDLATLSHKNKACQKSETER